MNFIQTGVKVKVPNFLQIQLYCFGGIELAEKRNSQIT